MVVVAGWEMEVEEEVVVEKGRVVEAGWVMEVEEGVADQEREVVMEKGRVVVAGWEMEVEEGVVDEAHRWQPRAQCSYCGEGGRSSKLRSLGWGWAGGSPLGGLEEGS
jgi:hypothetical protein